MDGSGNVFVTGNSRSGTSDDYVTVAYSGAGVPLWTNRYNEPGNGKAAAVAVDGSGNVFVTGYSATIAYSGAGVPLWTKRDGGTAIAVDANGNVFVTGRNDTDYTTIAYSGAGVPLWTNRYDRGLATAIAVDASGNVFVTGESWSGTSTDYATVAYSGGGVPLWTNLYNGPGNDVDRAKAVAVDSSGNVFVTGSSYVGRYFDYATVAYSGAGMPLWTNRYDGPGNGQAAAVAVDGSGNVFVTGSSGPDYATVGYSGAGAALWTNRYNGPGNDGASATAIAVDAGGNVFVTGESWSGTSTDYATVAYSGGGLPLWTNRYTGPANHDDRTFAVAVDGSGNVFVTGYSRGSDSSFDYATIKYSGAGVPLWTNLYSGSGLTDYAYAVAVDGSGNIFVTGKSHSGSSFDYATIAYSGAGVPLWTNRYDGPANDDDHAYAVAVDGSGNVFVTGYSRDSDSSYDYATIKYSGAGVPLWTNLYNGNREDYATALAVDGSGNVFVTGWSNDSDTSLDYATVAYSGAGAPLWTNRYNGPGNDYAMALAVDSRSNVFVTGSSATIAYSGAGAALWTNRYDWESSMTALAVDGSGNVFVTGNSWSGTSIDYATVAYSGAGVPLWTNRYNGPTNHYDSASAVAVDGSGNVFVTGNSWSGTSDDYVTVAYSGAGVPLWTNRYEGPGYSEVTGIAVDGSGNVFVTGISGSDCVTIKYWGVRPFLTIGPHEAGGYFLRFDGIPGSTYRLERAAAVTGPWTHSGRQTAPGSGQVEFLDSSAPPSQAFYRLQVE